MFISISIVCIVILLCSKLSDQSGLTIIHCHVVTSFRSTSGHCTLRIVEIIVLSDDPSYSLFTCHITSSPTLTSDQRTHDQGTRDAQIYITLNNFLHFKRHQMLSFTLRQMFLWPLDEWALNRPLFHDKDAGTIKSSVDGPWWEGEQCFMFTFT